MATLSSSARLVLKCEFKLCGKQFEQEPGALLRLGRAARFCTDPCLVEGAPELVCEACGDGTDPDRPGLYDQLLDGMRLPICQNCQYIAFRACWRKRCFPSEQLAAAWAEVYWAAGKIRGSGGLHRRLRPYECLLCARYHTTSGGGISDEHEQQLRMIAAVFDGIGFYVDDLRGWTINPDGSHSIAGSDSIEGHGDVHAARRVLQRARLAAEGER